MRHRNFTLGKKKQTSERTYKQKKKKKAGVLPMCMCYFCMITSETITILH